MLRVTPLDGEFGERGHVEQGGRLARGAVFGGYRRRPVGLGEGIAVGGLRARRREPVGPLPSHLFPEHRARRLQPRVQGRGELRPAGLGLFLRPADGVVLAVVFERAGADPLDILVRNAEAADVHRPEVHGRLAARDPFGQGLARPAAGNDAEGIEARADKKSRHPRRFAQNKVPVGGEGFGPVDQGLDSGRLQRRDARDGRFHRRAELVPIGIEQGEMESLGDSVFRPGLRVQLEGAHDQAADFFLVVDQPVGIAHRRQIARHSRNRLGDQVLVPHRNQRHVDAGKPAHLARPLSGAVDRHLADNTSFGGFDGADPAVLQGNAGDRAILDDLGAGHARAARQGLGDIRGVRLAVAGRVGGADDVGGIHDRPELQGLVAADDVHLHAEAFRRGHQPLDLDQAFLRTGEPQAARHLPARGLAGLGLEALVKFDAVRQQPGDVGVGAQLADQPGGMEGGPARQFVALEQHHVLPAQPGQMIGDRAADDTAADDDRASLSGYPAHVALPSRRCRFSAAPPWPAGPAPRSSCELPRCARRNSSHRRRRRAARRCRRASGRGAGFPSARHR